MNYPTDDLSSEDEYWIDTGKSIDDLEVETLAELAALRAEIECSVKETKTDIKRVYWYKQDMWDRVLSKQQEDSSQPDAILNEICCLDFKKVHDEYLKYQEKHRMSEGEVEAPSNPQSSSLGLRKPVGQSVGDDIICLVCHDGDYEDENLIVICSSCEMAFHMSCYGIKDLPPDDWYCEGCKSFGGKAYQQMQICALCPVYGGAVKPTLTKNDGSFLQQKKEIVEFTEMIW